MFSLNFFALERAEVSYTNGNQSHVPYRKSNYKIKYKESQGHDGQMFNHHGRIVHQTLSFWLVLSLCKKEGKQALGRCSRYATGRETVLEAMGIETELGSGLVLMQSALTSRAGASHVPHGTRPQPGYG